MASPSNTGIYAPWFVQPPSYPGKLTMAWHSALSREYQFANAEARGYKASDRWFMQDRADAFPATLGYLPQATHTAWPSPPGAPNSTERSGDVYLRAIGLGGV